MKQYFVVALAAIAWALPGMQMEAQGQTSRERGKSLLLVDVAFQGGNALEYIEALRAAGSDVNIVVDYPEAVAGVPMAAVVLSSVNLAAALELLDDRQGESPDGRNVLLSVRTRQPDQAGAKDLYGNPLFQVNCNFLGSIFEESVEEISGVWTVADLLASQMGSADMLTAIETALDLFSDRAKPPEMRFHEPTGLLIARGEEEQLEVIDNIIDELRSTVMLRERAGRRQEQNNELEAAEQTIAGLEVEKQRLELETRRIEVEVTGMEAARQQEIANLSHQLNRCQNEVETLQAEMQRATAR